LAPTRPILPPYRADLSNEESIGPLSPCYEGSFARSCGFGHFQADPSLVELLLKTRASLSPFFLSSNLESPSSLPERVVSRYFSPPVFVIFSIEPVSAIFVSFYN